MNEQDVKRLQRERDIALAVAGPNYEQLESAIRKVKAEKQKRAQASRERYIRERNGYYDAVSKGEVQRIDGVAPKFRDDPTMGM